ncbi:MAG: low specificity L-threonine aldolase [Bdellovibrionales bacterium]
MIFKRGFGSDNHASIHPEIIEALLKVNQGHAAAYGQDDVTGKARLLLRQHFGDDIHAYFVFNGTAANVLCLRALLASHEAVITTESSHLAVDECGAPEFHGGHKVITVKSVDGKLRPQDIEPLLIRRGDQHAVQPRLVSITQPTELGTVYTLEEMRELRAFTRQKNLMLHVDGARLANAAAHLNCTLKQITSDIGIDALSLGGTKNGLLGGEAVLFFGRNPEHFKYIQKQEMQLPSKLRYVAAQFIAYLENDLWKKIALRSLNLAQELRQALSDIPQVQVTQNTQSNAVFARIPKSWTSKLKDTCFFYVWDENEWVVRLMLSHDNQSSDIELFRQTLLELSLNQKV